MVFWLLLLGIITYIILRTRVAHLTRTPLWVLWLVLMTPAFIWTAWFVVHGNNEPLPTEVAVGSFILSPIIYWFAFSWGRRDFRPPPAEGVATSSTEESDSEQKDGGLPKLADVRPISAEEEQELRDCFDWTVYPLHKLDYRPQAIICRGQLRSRPEVAYQRIREKIEGKFGDRFAIIFQEDFHGKPFFILVPNITPTPDGSQLNKPLLALSLAAITLFTTTVVGTTLGGISPETLQSQPTLLVEGLPYAISLMTILGIHESGHYLAAIAHNIRTTLPYFIPFPIFLGTFGAFVQIRSPMPNRKVLFDISIAGPMAGFVVTLPILFWGLANSTVVELPEDPSMFSIDALDPTFSLLLLLLSKFALGSQLTPTSGIDLHPVAIAGYIGLIVTAFNLLPVGQLDGGHIVHGMFGQRQAARIGQVSRFLVLGLAVLQPSWFLLAVFLFFMPIIDSPALNDISELDNRRDLCGLLAIAVLLLIILPAPNLVMNWLQG